MKELVTVKKKQSTQAPLEFIGDMQTGVAYVQMMFIVLLTGSAIFVW